ncbi:MAG: Na+/H+ antiporter subunit E [Campylobacterota bacterium]|nr:Na+/H+ antiporter subunit E [Campylobacterota bacterium]
MIGNFILLFIVWIGLTNSLDIQELFVGAIVSFVVVYFFTGSSKIDLMKELKKHIKLTPLFIKDLILANIEVAKIVLNPKLPINPDIVKLNLDLDNDFDKLLIANAITLTPGTITLDITQDEILIHILDLKTQNKEILQKDIIEKYKLIM